MRTRRFVNHTYYIGFSSLWKESWKSGLVSMLAFTLFLWDSWGKCQNWAWTWRRIPACCRGWCSPDFINRRFDYSNRFLTNKNPSSVCYAASRMYGYMANDPYAHRIFSFGPMDQSSCVNGLVCPRRFGFCLVQPRLSPHLDCFINTYS